MRLANPLLLLSASVVLSGSSPALAHELVVACRVADGRLRVEAYYHTSSRPPAAGAKVLVKKEDGALVAEGQTDDAGIWSCPAPVDGKYIVRAETVGHQVDEPLTVGAPAPPKEEPGVPWLQVGLGLAIIALTCVAFWVTRKKRGRSAPAPDA